MALPLPLPAWQQRELVRERETFRFVLPRVIIRVSLTDIQLVDMIPR